MQTIPNGDNGFSGVKTREEWKVVSEPSPTELGTPVTRHPHSSAAPPQAHLEPQGCHLFKCCRLWLQHKSQRLRTFIRRCHSSTQDWGQEREEEVVCPTASRNWELPCTANRGQRGLKGERASTMKWNPISPTKPSWTELLEHEVQKLLPTLLHRDIISIFSFLENYNEFASTEEVLDLLFTEYGCIVAAYGDNDAVLQWWKMAISCILDIWLEYYQEDFHQLPEFPSLTKLEFMRQRMSGSDLEHRARRYLKQFRHLYAAEPEARALARKQHPESPKEPTPAPTVGPAAPSGPEVIEQVLAIPAAESKPLQIVVIALFHCSTLEEPPAPSATPEEDHHLSLEQLASTPEQHPEPPQEPAPAPTAGLMMAAAQRRLALPCHFTVSIF
ncbi:unnamed protein product [Nyctereutes procyonoides]|uniref:(raccoon dog) hypothetical protein n=1 Tax=Nyctereutes procyonoides TaxID=34880 RepID=A0A811ZVK5_NYCPR|nr:unnamed protein product [Nyctereutes procyonoides]